MSATRCRRGDELKITLTTGPKLETPVSVKSLCTVECMCLDLAIKIQSNHRSFGKVTVLIATYRNGARVGHEDPTMGEVQLAPARAETEYTAFSVER